MEKRGFLLVPLIVLSVLFFTINVTSLTQCSDDQTILKLSSLTNAHAESVGQTNYDIRICYSDIFNGVIGNGNRVCDGSNTVLKLSSLTNAHAEAPTGTNYPNEICYGNLNCRVSTSCSNNEAAVVKISSLTNAHLELTSENNYNYFVCCIVAGIVPPQCSDSKDNDGDGLIDLNDPGCSNANDNDEIDNEQIGARAYWADINDREFANNAQVNVGDSVKLIAEDVPANSRVSFVILDDDSPRPDQELRTLTVDSIGTTAKVSWTIGPNDYTKGNDLLEIGPLELYFRAIVSDQYDQRSQTLLLSDTIGPNPPPNTPTGCNAYNQEEFIAGLQGSPTPEDACNKDLGNQLGNDPAYAKANSQFLDQFGAGCNQDIIDKNGNSIKTTCSCNWKNDECGFNSAHSIAFPGIGPGQPVCAPNCAYDYFVGECKNNVQTINSVRTFDNLANCDDNQKKIAEADCPIQPDAKAECGTDNRLLLPFFGFSQFLISLIGIIIVYFISHKKEG